jgi:endonuclease YncB( thermonuclease family)
VGWTNPTKTSNHCARHAKINRNDNVTIQNVANGQTQEMKYKNREPYRFRTMGIGKLIPSFYNNKTPLRK